MSSWTIWKFGPFKPGQLARREAPSIIEARHFGALLDDLYVWCEVNPTAVKSLVDFQVFGTGWEVPPGWTYVGTAVQGAYVWHLFTRPTPLDLDRP